MPLIQTAIFPASNSTNGSWALWQIKESEELLLTQLNAGLFPLEELQEIKVVQRRLEWLSCRLALQALLPRSTGIFLRKNAFGKPYLDGASWHISLSHTYPYAAAALHAHKPVGLDVEQTRVQLLRIKHKFLSEREQAWTGDDLQKLCLCWAAKEALYKLHGQAGLSFVRDIALMPVEEAGCMQARLLGAAYALQYQWHEDLLICIAS